MSTKRSFMMEAEFPVLALGEHEAERVRCVLPRAGCSPALGASLAKLLEQMTRLQRLTQELTGTDRGEATQDLRTGVRDRLLRVVLVDDEPGVRALVKALLSHQAGIEIVAEARDGVEAVEVADRLRPDILLMDLHMPKMDGLEATRRVKARVPDVKIIGFSTCEEDEVSRKMLDAGADAYLTKTSPVEALIAAVLGVSLDSGAALDTALELG